MSILDTTAPSAGGNRDAAPAAGARRLSIVVPAYNEEEGLAAFHERLGATARGLAASRGLVCEVVYVDDGSRDGTLAVARALSPAGLDVQVVSLSRNFGKEAALVAGLDHARYEAVLFMDSDGQHPAEFIERLVAHWIDDGYDVVYTAKSGRGSEPLLRRLGVKIFYTTLNWGARHKIPEDAGDFRLLSPRAAAALRQMPERNRFFKGLSSWIGFRQLRVDYQPADRVHGSSKWNVKQLVGLSIEGLTSFSVAPLRIASLLGIMLAGVAFIFGVHILIETLVFGRYLPGYPSMIVGTMVIGGVQLIMIGILGEYIGKILSELKRRPAYFVAEHSVLPADTSEASRMAAPSPAGPGDAREHRPAAE